MRGLITASFVLIATFAFACLPPPVETVAADFTVVVESTEQPVAGKTVHLTDAAGKEIARAVLDSKGEARFSGLAPGAYEVAVLMPPLVRQVAIGPWVRVEVVAGKREGVKDRVVISGLGFTPIRVQHGKGAIYTGYYDQRHPEDRSDLDPLAGYALELAEPPTYRVLARTTTDANGHFNFASISPGTFVVHILPKAEKYGEPAGDIGIEVAHDKSLPDEISVLLHPSSCGLLYETVPEAPHAK